MAKFCRRSYFKKVFFQIRKYKILGDGHFKGVHIATFEPHLFSSNINVEQCSIPNVNSY